MPQRLGYHYIAELWGCPREILDDRIRLQNFSIQAAKVARVTVLHSQFHQFSPQGVTGLLLLSESHLSLHTWPEHGYCAVDLFTCGDAKAGREAILELSTCLGANRIELQIVGRGHVERQSAMNVERKVIYPPFRGMRDKMRLLVG